MAPPDGRGVPFQLSFSGNALTEALKEARFHGDSKPLQVDNQD